MGMDHVLISVLCPEMLLISLPCVGSQSMVEIPFRLAAPVKISRTVFIHA